MTWLALWWMAPAEAQEYVIVAARDIYAGVTLTEDDLYAVDIADQPYAPPPEAMRDPDLVVGRIVRSRILANEVVRGVRLDDPEGGWGLGSIIPRRMRGILIQTPDASMVRPGAYVDVLGDGCLWMQTLFVLSSPLRDLGHGPRALTTPPGSLLVMVADVHVPRAVHAVSTGPLRVVVRHDHDVAQVPDVPRCDVGASSP